MDESYDIDLFYHVLFQEDFQYLVELTGFLFFNIRLKYKKR